MMGNNDYADGRGVWDDHEISLLGDLGADEQHLFDGRELARDSRALHIGVDWIRNNPHRFVLLWPKKFKELYLSDVEGFHFSIGTWLQRSGQGMGGVLYLGLRTVGEVYYMVIILLFAASMPTILRGKNITWGIGVFLCVYFTLLSLIFFGHSRYHFPLMPWVAMYAGIGAALVLKSYEWPARIADTDVTGEPLP